MIDSAALLASRQGGIVRRSQLIDLGIPASTIGDRVATGRYAAVIDGVYRVLELPRWRDRVLAAVNGLPSAIASHETAAAVLGFPDFDHTQVIVTVHSKRTHDWPGATVHRARDLASKDRSIADSIPVTSRARTLFDMAAILPESRFVDLADSVVSTGKVDVDALLEVGTRLCRRGKTGSSVVRRYLEGAVDSGVVSPLERRGLLLLKQAQISGFVTEFEIPWSPSQRFDVAFPDKRIAIEWDSRAFHTGSAAFQNDRERDRLAHLHGWRVLRFTWRDVTTRPDEVIATVISIHGE